MLPHTGDQYDFIRHLGRGDVMFAQTEATVLIKWPKINHFREKKFLYIGPLFALLTFVSCHCT